MECTQCSSIKVEAFGLCASCAHQASKAAKVKVKVVTPPKRVSEREAKRLAEYAPIRAGQLKDHPILPA